MVGILDKYSDTFISELEMIGFSRRKARLLLLEFSSALLESDQHQNSSQMINDLLSKNPASLLKSIDIRSISYRLIIDIRQIKRALQKIEPLMSHYMLQQKDSIVGFVSMLGWGPQGQPRRVLKNIF